MSTPRRAPWALGLVLLLASSTPQTRGQAQVDVAAPAWSSDRCARIRLSVDGRGRKRSNSPASVTIDFQGALRDCGVNDDFDESTVEVVWPGPRSGGTGAAPARIPHRVDRLFGSTRATLAFVIPDETATELFVYFDTAASGRGNPDHYAGLVGDGDFFREESQRREIAPSHFDQLVDFDGDRDLDLFQGGVEPFVQVWENVGGNRLVPRGRLASGNELFTLPCSSSRRSWVTVAFFDLDADGDQDFFPSFNDGPDSGQIVFYRNVTRERGAILTLDRVGPLKTSSGVPLAGGPQAGGWFPSITFVRGLTGNASGDGGVDAVVGSNNHCWLYRGLGMDGGGSPRFADAVALQAGGEDIVLVNPRLECADVDGDADLDLFAGTQPGPVLFFRNEGSRSQPQFAAGRVVAFEGKYLIGDAHSGVKVADLDGDGLLDLVAGRFWERADRNHPDSPREFGGFWKNVGAPAEPRFERRIEGGLHLEGQPICDAVRQNCVRAFDWDRDGQLDLLAGDTDGFIWLFRNRNKGAFSIFAAGQKLKAAGQVLCLADSGGHARPDVCDWNEDGLLDLVVADASGAVTLFLGTGGGASPTLDAGRRLEAGGKPVQVGPRASALVCDWNADGKKDLILAGEKSYWLLRNVGTNSAPALEEPRVILFGGKPVSYVRPNLGSFVDWDGDGRRDLIGCNFENNIRLYRNVDRGSPGTEPQFADPEGVAILVGSSPQMISGADAVDWNGDGDLDILTGQGHGGSGLRFFERDWIEDELHGTHPIVTARPPESRAFVLGRAPATGASESLDLLAVVRRYADFMMAHGRDVHGPVETGLFLSALDRSSLGLLTVRPAAPGGIRRGDRPGRAWSAMNGANPHLDQNLLRILVALGDLTGDTRYTHAVDEELTWFLKHAMSSATSLLPWGEHLSWDVVFDVPICGGDEMMHEFARPWVLWDRCFGLAPEASRKFAVGLWEHQIADHKSGGFDRHAPFLNHGPVDGKDFPRHAGFYIGTWCFAWKHTSDETFLRAIECLLARFERKRVQRDGSRAATIGPLDCETAASMVPEPLASRLRAFAAEEDALLLPDLQKQVEAHAHAESRPPNLPLAPMWANGYSASTLASSAMFCLARFEQTKNPAYSDLILAVADLYLGSWPEEDLDVWPLGFAHAISTQVAAHRLSGKSLYLEQALAWSSRAVEIFWQDSPLPRASFQTGHYETITGADSLALALLDAHAAAHHLKQLIPSNTIDR